MIQVQCDLIDFVNQNYLFRPCSFIKFNFRRRGSIKFFSMGSLIVIYFSKNDSVVIMIFNDFRNITLKKGSKILEE